MNPQRASFSHHDPQIKFPKLFTRPFSTPSASSNAPWLSSSRMPNSLNSAMISAAETEPKRWLASAEVVKRWKESGWGSNVRVSRS